MIFNEKLPVSQGKVENLKIRLEKLGVKWDQIIEKFTKGSGKGGQKINKTSNAVQLSYEPLGLNIKVQRERSRSLNRYLALRELVDQIEIKINPQASARLKKWDKLKKQKSRRARKAKEKHQR